MSLKYSSWNSKIVSDENINVKNYTQDILNKTDLLFYPSKYPVGVRSKILYVFKKMVCCNFQNY